LTNGIVHLRSDGYGTTHLASPVTPIKFSYNFKLMLQVSVLDRRHARQRLLELICPDQLPRRYGGDSDRDLADNWGPWRPFVPAGQQPPWEGAAGATGAGGKSRGQGVPVAAAATVAAAPPAGVLTSKVLPAPAAAAAPAPVARASPPLPLVQVQVPGGGTRLVLDSHRK
jgi:hypothetical protein